MFDSKNDYVLNKMDPEAIVCRSATGVHIRLTRKDFASDEEFHEWKELSDDDYYKMVNDGRDFYDNCISLNEALDSVGLSVEDVLLTPVLEQERQERRQACIGQIRNALTDKQYRRLCLYFLQGMTEREIAESEGVGQQRISVSISSGIKALKKSLKNF